MRVSRSSPIQTAQIRLASVPHDHQLSLVVVPESPWSPLGHPNDPIPKAIPPTTPAMTGTRRCPLCIGSIGAYSTIHRTDPPWAACSICGKYTMAMV